MGSIWAVGTRLGDQLPLRETPILASAAQSRKVADGPPWTITRDERCRGHEPESGTINALGSADPVPADTRRPPSRGASPPSPPRQLARTPACPPRRLARVGIAHRAPSGTSGRNGKTCSAWRPTAAPGSDSPRARVGIVMCAAWRTSGSARQQSRESEKPSTSFGACRK